MTQPTNIIRARLNSNRVSHWRVVVLLWLVSAACLLALNTFRDGPYILADELGYLGIARWLAGAAPLPNMLHASFYHFGYSFLITPAFWIGHDPINAYKWALAINCLLAATIAPLSYVFAKKAFHVNSRMAILMAALATLYPANIVQTNFAWSENALPPLLLGWSIVLVCMHERTSRARLITLSLLAVSLFFVHPRMLGIELVTLLYLVAGAITCKSRRWSYVIATAILVIAHILVAHGLSVVRHLEYHGVQGNVTSFLHNLPHLAAVGMKLPAAISGQLLYVSYGSEGLIIIGIMMLGVVSFQRYMVSRTNVSCIQSLVMNEKVILLAGIASIFVVSGIFMSSGNRVDHWMYGRYVDSCSPILIIAGIAAASNKRLIWILARWLVIVLCVATTIWFTYATITSPNIIVYADIPTLAPLIHGLQGFAGSKHIAFAVIMLLAMVPALLFIAARKSALVPILTLYVVLSIVTIGNWRARLPNYVVYPPWAMAIRSELANHNLLRSTILAYRDSFSESSFIVVFFRMEYLLDKNKFVVSDKVSDPAECARFGTRRDLAASAPVVGKPIPVSTNSVFWITKQTPASPPCP